MAETIFIGDESGEALALSLENLASELRALAKGGKPPGLQLSEAPVLDQWRVGHRSVPALFGQTEGHPILLGPNICTSELFAVDAHGQWARTLSRYYRLGRALAVSLPN